MSEKRETTSSLSGHVVVVDDHDDIRQLLARYLVLHGFKVFQANSVAACRQILSNTVVDLLILDVMMPEEDGLSFCRELQTQTDVPAIILLTAMAEETDRIIGLELGADDYITKPFSQRELLARIKAVLRRTGRFRKQREKVGDMVERQIIYFNGWCLDESSRHVTDEIGIVKALSTAEFRLLMTFIRHPNRTLSRDQLLDMTKGREALPFDRSIDNQVSRLRKKIEKDPAHPEMIKTVWGGGYCFVATIKYKK